MVLPFFGFKIREGLFKGFACPVIACLSFGVQFKEKNAVFFMDPFCFDFLSFQGGAHGIKILFPPGGVLVMAVRPLAEMWKMVTALKAFFPEDIISVKYRLFIYLFALRSSGFKSP